MIESKKNLNSFFLQIKFTVLKKCDKKIYLAIVPHVFCFFSQIYTTWLILIGFAYTSISVCFKAILMSYLSFLSQKIYPDDFLRAEFILGRKFLQRCSIWLGPSPIIIFPLFRNAIKSEPLGVRD